MYKIERDCLKLNNNISFNINKMTEPITIFDPTLNGTFTFKGGRISSFERDPKPILNFDKQLILNAEVDGSGWSYTSLNHGSLVYRYKKKDIHFKEKEALKDINLIQLENLYERKDNQWVIKDWIWLHGIDGVFSIKDALKQDWGKDIIRLKK